MTNKIEWRSDLNLAIQTASDKNKYVFVDFFNRG